MKTYKKEMLYCSGMGIRIEPHRVVRMDEHLHEFVEAVYIMDGSGVHTVNGVEYRVKRGALLFSTTIRPIAFPARTLWRFGTFALTPNGSANG